jgi:hypothetical protein
MYASSDPKQIRVIQMIHSLHMNTIHLYVIVEKYSYILHYIIY